MAVDTMEAAIKARGLKPARDCQTDGLFLEGGEGFSSNDFIRLVQDFGLEVEVGWSQIIFHCSLGTRLMYSLWVCLCT